MVGWRLEFHAVGASIITDNDLLLHRRVAHTAVEADLGGDLQRGAVVHGVLAQSDAQRPRCAVLRWRGAFNHGERDIVTRVHIFAAFAFPGLHTEGGRKQQTERR